jgi:EPS-associated MarR family transcriptional regulator
MNEHVKEEEVLTIIKEVEANPSLTQRAVSSKLGISLGKINYLLKNLIQKGIIKVESFSTHPGKLKKISYLVTPKGFEEKMRLVYYFLKKKEAEYKLLKEEWKSQKGKG